MKNNHLEEECIMSVQVSVILATYNGFSKGFLNKAIESVLSQTYINFELLIINDGSTDDTLHFCQTYVKQDKRVHFFSKKNGGPASARNLGISLSKGRYICFIDDDDEWENHKLESQLQYWNEVSKKEEKLGMITSFIKRELENGVIEKGRFKIGKIKEKELFFSNSISLSSVMILKNIFDEIDDFNESSCLISSEDYDLWLRVIKKYAVYMQNQYLVLYRVRSGNLSGNIEKQFSARLCCLLRNLPDSTDRIYKDRIFFKLYTDYANRFFTNYQMKYFRKFFIISLAYKFPGVKMWVKFFLSFLRRKL